MDSNYHLISRFDRVARARDSDVYEAQKIPRWH